MSGEVQHEAKLLKHRNRCMQHLFIGDFYDGQAVGFQKGPPFRIMLLTDAVDAAEYLNGDVLVWYQDVAGIRPDDPFGEGLIAAHLRDLIIFRLATEY